jgi:hypothetical protein
LIIILSEPAVKQNIRYSQQGKHETRADEHAGDNQVECPNFIGEKIGKNPPDDAPGIQYRNLACAQFAIKSSARMLTE